MKTKTTYLLLMCAFMCAFQSTKAQQPSDDEILLERYWNYRERQQKHFVKIGSQKGESIPIIRIEPNFATYIIPANKIGLQIPDGQKYQTLYGKAKFGDAGVDLGYYIAMLSTEYALLKKDNADLTSVENELYYALEAINRLDRNAEDWFGGNAALNGFFIREDVPSDFYEQFEELGDPVRAVNNRVAVNEVDYTPYDANGNALPIVKMFEDADGNLLVQTWDNKVRQPGFNEDYDDGQYGSKGNEMSQDQVVGIIFGLKCVTEFVDDIYVKPKATDNGFYLVTEAKAIAERILDPIAANKTCLPQVHLDDDGIEICANAPSYVEDGSDIGNCNIKSIEAEWIIRNPINNKAVYRGPSFFTNGFGFPFKEIAEDMYNESTYDNIANIEIERYITPTTTLVQNSSINQSTRFGIFVATGANASISDAFYNANMSAKLAAAAGADVMDFEDLYDMVDAWDYPHLELLYSVINNETPNESQSFYRDLLLEAPCRGPWFDHTVSNPTVSAAQANIDANSLLIAQLTVQLANTTDPALRASLEFQINFLLLQNNGYLKQINDVTGIWNKEDAMSISKEGHFHHGLWRDGLFNGNDFALLYNLYRLSFDNPLDDNFAMEYSCPCTEGILNKDINLYDNSDNPITLVKSGTSYVNVSSEYRFPEYIDINIRLNSYLTHDVEVGLGGTFNTQGNFVLCNSVLTVNEGNLSVGTVLDNRLKYFNAANGSEIVLSNNAVLKVNNNSTLVIEEGATLNIGLGTQVILDGPDAILEIRGNLVLEDGAVFAPIGGPNGQGFVRFKMDGIWSTNAADRIDVGQGSKMIFEGFGTNTKVLEIEGQTLWIDDKGTSNFEFSLKNAIAELGHEVYLNLGCRSTFDGAVVQKTAAAGHYDAVYLWTHDHKIVNSTFKQGSNGLRYTSNSAGMRLKVENSSFIENYNGLVVHGGGLDLIDVNAELNTNYGLFAHALKLPGSIYNSRFINNDARGIRYESNTGAGLVMSESELEDNYSAMKFISTGALQLKCNKFRGRGSSSSPIGLEFYSGSLLMSHGTFSGNNKFLFNETNIALMEKWGQYVKIYLDDGYNMLSGKTNILDDEMAIEGFMDYTGIGAYQANYNMWDNTTSGANAPISVFGGSGYENYSVKYPLPLVGWVTMADANAQSESNFYSSWTSTCTSGYIGPMYGAADDDVFDDNKGTTINTTNILNKPLSKAVEDIMIMSADTTKPLSEITSLWNELLTYNGFPNQLTAEDEYFLDIASSQILSVAGQHFANVGATVKGDINTPIAQDVVTSCDFWMAKLQNDTSLYSVKFKNKIHLKKGHILYLTEEDTLAQGVFSGILTWGDSGTVAEANYWICEIGQMQQLRNSNYDCVLLSSLPDCDFDPVVSFQFKRESNIPAKPEFNSEFGIYPNPSTDYIIVTYLTDDVQSIDIRIIDIFGTEQIQMNGIKTFVGLNQARITTNNLASGTYIVKLISEKQTLLKKVVIGN
jgi:hypothetical protein